MRENKGQAGDATLVDRIEAVLVRFDPADWHDGWVNARRIAEAVACDLEGCCPDTKSASALSGAFSLSMPASVYLETFRLQPHSGCVLGGEKTPLERSQESKFPIRRE